MHFGKRSPIFVVGALILFLIIIVALISTYWPRYEARFFELALLGKEKTADEYFPNDNFTLPIGYRISWYIFIHNHMGSAQDISVRVKLLNFTMDLPNDQEHESSPFASLVEFPSSLSTDDTVLIPFSWSISHAVLQDDRIVLKRILINDQILEADVPAASDSSFRMVFELWVYDSYSQDYTFGWRSGEEFSSASVYMGFKVAGVVA